MRKVRYQLLDERVAAIARSRAADFAGLTVDASRIPTFDERIVTIGDLLPSAVFARMRERVAEARHATRSYIPIHKKGGTVGYAELCECAPLLVGFYQSAFLRDLCSRIVGERVGPTPVRDQSSCSLLVYDRPSDHIEWHYDHNFYHGRHFTLLYPLVNTGRVANSLSSARLVIRLAGGERVVPTPSNSLVLFEGTRVRHKVDGLGNGELRVVLSMTYCTNRATSTAKEIARRFKDTAYFGVRALYR